MRKTCQILALPTGKIAKPHSKPLTLKKLIHMLDVY